MKKYTIKNLRTNEFEVSYDNIERAERYIRISVYYENYKKTLNIKRWSKKDFEIIEEED